MSKSESGSVIIDHNGVWDRQPTEIVAFVNLSDPLSVRQRKYLFLQPSYSAFVVDTQGHTIELSAGKPRIPKDSIFLLIYSKNYFVIEYEFQYFKTKLSFVVDNRWLENLQRSWFDKKTRIYEADLRNRLGEIVDQIVCQEVQEDKDKDIILNKPHRLELAIENVVKNQYTYQLGLDLVEVKVLAIKEIIKDVVYQNPQIPYVVVDDRKALNRYQAVPISKGKCFLGRSSNRQCLEEYLRKKGYWSVGNQAVSLPMKPCVREAIPLGEISKKNYKYYEFLAGWTNFSSSEKIVLENKEIQPNQSVRLHGFEKIEFKGDPEISMFFIPPIELIKHHLSIKRLEILEQYGLWAMAGYGWLYFREIERAKAAFEKALKGPMDDDIRANILMATGRLMRSTAAASDPVGLNNQDFEREASTLLGAPAFKIFISGKQVKLDEESRIKIEGNNCSDQMDAYQVRLEIRCDGVGIHEMYQVGDVKAGKHFGPLLFSLQAYRPGEFPLDITLSYVTAKNDHLIQTIQEQIDVVKRPGKISISGAVGAVSIRNGQEDDLPNIEIGKDVGGVFIRRENKCHQCPQCGDDLVPDGEFCKACGCRV